MKVIQKLGKHLRLCVQIAFTALTNGYLIGFAEGKIYRGSTKRICVPGLNCYSCPGAVASCPMGALQAVISSSQYRFSFYIAGFLMIVGSLMGRFVCGWLCPFGLVQDLLHKLPVKRKIKKVPFDRQLRRLKYFVLVIFVLILPMLVKDAAGNGVPWFCKLICPSGTLMGGIPLTAANEFLRQAAGGLFSWKIALLLVIIILSVILYRPFCKYLCPLGVVYGIFHRFSLYHYEIDHEKCTKCGRCHEICEMNVKVYEQPDSPECIRCGKCIKNCPGQAIHAGMRFKNE